MGHVNSEYGMMVRLEVERDFLTHIGGNTVNGIYSFGHLFNVVVFLFRQ
jgi:hypothetical protein